MENTSLDEFNRAAADKKVYEEIEKEREEAIKKEKERQDKDYQKDLDQVLKKASLEKMEIQHTPFGNISKPRTKEQIKKEAQKILDYQNQKKLDAINKDFDKKNEHERQREREKQREKHEAQRQEKEHSKNEIGSNRTGRMHNGGKDRPEPERVRTPFVENAEEITKKRANSEKTRDSEKTTGSRRSSSRKRADKDKERGMDDDSLER